MDTRKLITVLANVPEVIGGLAIAAITVIIFVAVVWRYFLVDPITWSDDIVRILFVWLAFIGAAIGVKRRLHSVVLVFGSRLSASWQRFMTVLGLTVIAVMAGVLLYVGARDTLASFKEIMPMTGISRGWMYLAVPVAGALILAYLVPQYWKVLRGLPLPSPHETVAE